MELVRTVGLFMIIRVMVRIAMMEMIKVTTRIRVFFPDSLLYFVRFFEIRYFDFLTISFILFYYRIWRLKSQIV